MKTLAFLCLLLLAGALVLAGCTQPQVPQVTPTSTTAPPVTTAPPTPTPTPVTSTIKLVTNAQYGRIITDSNGRTLYYFLKDTPGAMTSACTGACIGIWPAFYAPTVQVPDPLIASSFDDFVRADGTQQTTFMGWPLYYYASDTAPGDAKGYGFNNLWYVVGSSGVVTLAPTTPVPTTTRPTTMPTTPSYYGGGGY
jgi:predicted lipoprotein with Yx(FWY)xxD motif